MLNIQNINFWLGLIASVLAVFAAIVGLVRFLFRRSKRSGLTPGSTPPLLVARQPLLQQPAGGPGLMFSSPDQKAHGTVKPRGARRQRVKLAVLAGLAIGIVGAGVYYVKTNEVSSPNVTGSWNVVFQLEAYTDSPAPWDGTMTLRQNHIIVKGSLTLDNDIAVPITGTISGNKITLYTTLTNANITLGGAATDATDMSGTITGDYLYNPFTFSGSWTAFKS